MPYTREEIIRLINLDEPDYNIIMSKLSKSDIPVLIELAQEEDVAVAVKAINCLGLMDSEEAVTGIESAIVNANPILRVSAANALKHSPSVPSSIRLISDLLDDSDVGVRKFALKTVLHSNIKSLKEKVQQLTKKEDTELMRDLSKEVYTRISQ